MTPDNPRDDTDISNTFAARQVNAQHRSVDQYRLLELGGSRKRLEGALASAREVEEFMASGSYVTEENAAALSNVPFKILPCPDPEHTIEVFDRSSVGIRPPYKGDELVDMLKTIPPLPIITVEDHRFTATLEHFFIEAISYAGQFCPEGAEQALANDRIVLIESEGDWAFYRSLAQSESGFPPYDSWFVSTSFNTWFARRELSEAYVTFDPHLKDSNSAARAVFHVAEMVRDLLISWESQGHKISQEFPLQGPIILEPHAVVDQSIVLEHACIVHEQEELKGPQVYIAPADNLYKGNVCDASANVLESDTAKVAAYIENGGLPFPRTEGQSFADMIKLLERMANWTARACAEGDERLVNYSFAALKVDMDTFKTLAAYSSLSGVQCRPDTRIVCIPGTNLLALNPLNDPFAFSPLRLGPEEMHEAFKVRAILARDIATIMRNYLYAEGYDYKKLPWPLDKCYF